MEQVLQVVKDLGEMLDPLVLQAREERRVRMVSQDLRVFLDFKEIRVVLDRRANQDPLDHLAQLDFEETLELGASPVLQVTSVLLGREVMWGQWGLWASRGHLVLQACRVPLVLLEAQGPQVLWDHRGRLELLESLDNQDLLVTQEPQETRVLLAMLVYPDHQGRMGNRDLQVLKVLQVSKVLQEILEHRDSQVELDLLVLWVPEETQAHREIRALLARPVQPDRPVEGETPDSVGFLALLVQSVLSDPPVT